MRSNVKRIAIVGGGISGLFCALRLAQRKIPVSLYEASPRLGGRIETWKIDDELYAEFGPMRIEPGAQRLLKQLLTELGIRDARDARNPQDGELVPFKEYTSPALEKPTFDLPKDEDTASLLDLLNLGLWRILRNIRNVNWNRRARTYFGEMDHGNVLRGRVSKAFSSFVQSLKDKDFDRLRRNGQVAGRSLWDMGFWNALSDVLSHFAVIKLRDWGSFYHLLPENPNAAEWIIFWLRGLQTSAHMRGLKGGMEIMVQRLSDKLAAFGTLVRIEQEMVLDDIRQSAHSVRLQFHKQGRAVEAVDAPHVILALPKRPLESLGHCLAPVAFDLDAVFGFPLLKCFFVIRNPWWEKERAPNTWAGSVPTRELHYFGGKGDARGMIMVYTDRPGTQFWADYLPRSNTQEKADTWSKEDMNDRLATKFEQYLWSTGTTEESFKSGNLELCGIRDWGRAPFGAAAHAWRPGARSWEVMDRLKAFSLIPDSDKRIHICGEAYSDYQGFIEGALRSAQNVLDVI